MLIHLTNVKNYRQVANRSEIMHAHLSLQLKAQELWNNAESRARMRRVCNIENTDKKTPSCYGCLAKIDLNMKITSVLNNIEIVRNKSVSMIQWIDLFQTKHHMARARGMHLLKKLDWTLSQDVEAYIFLTNWLKKNTRPTTWLQRCNINTLHRMHPWKGRCGYKSFLKYE